LRRQRSSSTHPEQYERYSDGSHQGKKKLEGNEKTENEKKLVEVRTKAGEKAKKVEEASVSRTVNVGELVKGREIQLAVQKDGKAEARKKEELLKEERATAQKKIQLEEHQKAKEAKKRKVRKEWQKSLRMVEEQKKKEDKIQFQKNLAKALAIKRGKRETVVV